MLILLLSGLPIGVALGLSAMIGLLLEGGVAGLASGTVIAFSVVSNWLFTAVPLFILMAEIMRNSRIMDDVYSTLSKWLEGLPGGAGIATTLGCSIFAATSGSSIACAATMGMVSVPELIRLGYRRSLAKGIVAAGGTLGILIPPSLALIFYGMLVEQSVGELFIAGVVPGIILATLFSLYIMLVEKLRPGLAPEAMVRSTWKDKIQCLPRMLPVLIIILFVLGGIYLGIVTPTEAAAVGAGCALVLTLARREIGRRQIIDALRNTAYTFSMLSLLVIGALMLGHLVTLWRIADLFASLMVEWNLPSYMILGALYLVLIILGLFLDGISILLITTPVFYPIVVSLGFDPIWYGVILVITLEIGLITPPVGLNLYVIHGLRSEEPFSEVVLGSLPFVVLMIMGLVLLTVFPQLCLWLPGTM